MSNVYFIGDLHLGHAKILGFSRGEFKTIEEHDEYICAIWESKIDKKDLVYVCGDAAFTKQGLERIGELAGRKVVVFGNHDEFSIYRYLDVFEDVRGFVKYKHRHERYWISHAPIHPDELRGGYNIHGHVHMNTIKKKNGETDTDYYNVSAENIGYEPRTIDELTKLRHESRSGGVSQ